MAKDEALARKLQEAFAAEAAERFQRIADGLLELEQACGGEEKGRLLETIQRDFHSLKGAGRSVGRADVEGLCQALESAIALMRKGEIAIQPSTLDSIHQVTGELETLARSTCPASPAAVENLASRVRSVVAQPATSARLEVGEKPQAPTAAPASAPAAPRAAEETVRLAASKLDTLLRQAGEMLAVKLAAGERVAGLRELSEELSEMHRRWSAILPELEAGTPAMRGFLAWQEQHLRRCRSRVASLAKAAQEEAVDHGRRVDQLLQMSRQALLVPFSSVLLPLPKMVRDIARQLGKEAALAIEGADIEVDRRVLEEVKDPLIHLVRNCLDHGLEAPEERARTGKPARGTITLRLSMAEHDVVRLEVSDDGAGVDVARVRQAAVERQVIRAGGASSMDEASILELVFKSGVSTSKAVTTISGRGLGLAIAREKVEALGGRVSLETRAGAGTTVRLLLPVTFATFRGVQVKAAGRLFVVPTACVERVGMVRSEDIRTAENRETIAFHGGALSFVRLAEALGLANGDTKASDQVPFLVLEAGGTTIALAVDEILREQEVLQQSLGRLLRGVRGSSGAAVLGGGIVVPVLNVADLLRSAAQGPTGREARARKPETEEARRKVLLVEDSITSRLLLKTILESAGYTVETAVDGLDALTALGTGSFDLVVSDVDMPRMDGFELTSRVRGDDRMRELPIVLVTARESREDRERGVEAGANAYVAKSSFEQDSLLETIRRLI